MASFLTGFAEGFITERKRRIEREQDLDDQSFQYRMKYLTDQREKRDAKKVKETELARKAKDLAATYGNNDFASTAYKELMNDIPFETMQKRIAEGYYQENKDYVKPAKTIKIPSAVSMEAADSQFPTNERVNKRIDTIDPTLRQAPVQEDSEFSTVVDEPTSQFIFKPNTEIKVGNLEQATYELDLAKDNNDPAAIREAQRKIRAITTATSMEAQAKARAENKDASLYLYKDDKGNIVSTLSAHIGPDGNLYNSDTNQIVDIQSKNQLVRVPEGAMKEWQAGDETIGKQSADLRAGSANFVSALDTTNKIANVLARSPEVTTFTAAGVELADNVVGEVKTAYQVLFGKENEIRERIRAGKTEGLEKLVADYERDALDFIERAESKGGVLGESNQRIALDKAIYDSLRNVLTFQMAAANGLSASKMSDADFKRFWDMIGGDKRDPNAVLQNIQNTSQTVISNIDSQRAQFNNLPMITGFKERWRFNPGWELPRIEDMLKQDGREDLVQTFRMLNGDIELRRLNAVQAAQEQNIQADPEMGGIHPKAIDMLRADPSPTARKHFDETFGPGSAAQILGE